MSISISSQIERLIRKDGKQDLSKLELFTNSDKNLTSTLDDESEVADEDITSENDISRSHCVSTYNLASPVTASKWNSSDKLICDKGSLKSHYGEVNSACIGAGGIQSIRDIKVTYQKRENSTWTSRRVSSHGEVQYKKQINLEESADLFSLSESSYSELSSMDSLLSSLPSSRRS